MLIIMWSHITSFVLKMWYSIIISYIESGTNVVLWITKNPFPDDIIADVFEYSMLCGQATAVAATWNKLWYCRIHGCYTEKEI